MVECFLGFAGLLSAGGSAGRSGVASVLCLFAGRSERTGDEVGVEVGVEVVLELSRLLYVLTIRLLVVETPPILALCVDSVLNEHRLGLCLASSCGFLLYRC